MYINTIIPKFTYKNKNGELVQANSFALKI